MITNKIIHILIVITSFIVIPVQMVTTFILGIFVTLTFGILLIPFTIIWIIVFLAPLVGLSYIFEKIAILRPFISIVGIPLAVIANAYIALLPSMGEMDSRLAKMVYVQTFPYTWKFYQYENNKLNIDQNDILAKILQRVSQAESLNVYLDKLRADVYSRPDYMSGKYKLDW